MGRNRERGGLQVVSNLIYADDTTAIAEGREELESLDEGERGEGKIWLKTQHSKN